MYDKSVRRVAARWVEARGNFSRLVMFDFDGTLFRSDEQTPDWWTNPGAFSWGLEPKSLDEPCVPGKPPTHYWNMHVVNAARDAVRDPTTMMVLVTGRVATHKTRILELLKQQGIAPEKIFFNPGMNAASFKKKVFGQLVISHPYISLIEIWENENTDVYGPYVQQLSRRLERDIEVETHRVAEKHVPVTCGPADFGMATASVADRWLVKTN